MPVDMLHSSYSEAAAKWFRIRAALSGERTVKTAGEQLLPKPSGMNDKQFEAYVERAEFVNVGKRTVKGYLGSIFRKEPSIIWPKPESRYHRLRDNIDLDGTPLEIFAQEIVRQVLQVGRYGVLADMTGAGEPFLAGYLAENIINWRLRSIGNRSVLDQVVLREFVEKKNDDGFGATMQSRFRVLELDEDLLYRQRLFERKSKDDAPVEVEVIEPKVRSQRLKMIPFVFYGSENLEPAIEQSPIEELIDANISHYRTSADLEHGAHWTALPTPWMTGVDDEVTVYTIGSAEAWKIANPEAKVGMLTLKGEDLGALERRLSAKRETMASLGARLFEEQKRAAETEGSKRAQYSGDNSILSQLANTCSRGLWQSVGWLVEWLGGKPQELTIGLNTDFFDTPMDPAMIRELVAAWQTGFMSHRTALYNLRRGEMMPPEWTVDDELDELGTQGPVGGPPDEEEDDPPDRAGSGAAAGPR